MNGMYIYKAYSYSKLASTLRPWLIIIRIAEVVGTPFWWVVRNVLSVIEWPTIFRSSSVIRQGACDQKRDSGRSRRYWVNRLSKTRALSKYILNLLDKAALTKLKGRVRKSYNFFDTHLIGLMFITEGKHH